MFNKDQIIKICREVADTCSSSEEFNAKIRSANLGVSAVISYCGKMYIGRVMYRDESLNISSTNF